MTTLEQQQKKARTRYDEKFDVFKHVAGTPYMSGGKMTNAYKENCNSEVKFFLDTEIAKAYNAGKEQMLSEIDKRLPHYENYRYGTNQRSISETRWQELKKSLSTEKLEVTEQV